MDFPDLPPLRLVATERYTLSYSLGVTSNVHPEYVRRFLNGLVDTIIRPELEAAMNAWTEGSPDAFMRFESMVSSYWRLYPRAEWRDLSEPPHETVEEELTALRERIQRRHPSSGNDYEPEADPYHGERGTLRWDDERGFDE